MDRNDAIRTVKELEHTTKKTIPISKYIRKKIVQDEIIEAYVTPVPTSVMTARGPLQVNTGKWVAIHLDGKQEAYTAEEFFKTFEPVSMGGKNV